MDFLYFLIYQNGNILRNNFMVSFHIDYPQVTGNAYLY